jgi:hypothetical protein
VPGEKKSQVRLRRHFYFGVAAESPAKTEVSPAHALLELPPSVM